MFFPERIISIATGDRVLEIGPGGSPHPRADVLLEKMFDTPGEAEEQRGHTPGLQTDKEVVFYEGGKFPFGDKEFDYVICSHVLEHVVNINDFLGEVVRVGKKGYLEYPSIYYDYIYNFKVHENLIHLRDDTIYWMKKNDTRLYDFFEVQKFFYESLVAGHDDLIIALKPYFFEGFEWFKEIKSIKVNDINFLCLRAEELKFEQKKEKQKINIIGQLYNMVRPGRRCD